jgi:peptide/nickel transport system permease protein
MSAYLLRRAIHSLLTIGLLVALLFVAFNILGDPVALMLPDTAPVEQIEAMRKALGLDQPLPIRLFDFYRGILRGDFGNSIRYATPALALVLERLPNTLLLAGVGMSLSLVGIPLGMLAARRPGKLLDRVVTLLSFVTLSTPEFWFALTLIIVFAVQLNILPTSGFGGFTGWQFLVLPAITMAFNPIGRFAQITRAVMIEEMTKQYITTARSKGLAERTVLARHALKNAAIAIVTLAGDQLAHFMNGSVVVETIFGWPGIGQLVLIAVKDRDLPLVTAAIVVIFLMVMAINLIVDSTYTWLDPRVRFGTKSS